MRTLALIKFTFIKDALLKRADKWGPTRMIAGHHSPQLSIGLSSKVQLLFCCCHVLNTLTNNLTLCRYILGISSE